MESASLQKLFQHIGISLGNKFDQRELSAIRKTIIEKVIGIPIHMVHIEGNKIIDNETWNRINTILNRLEADMPVQYILGEAHFMGMIFEVNPDVLIPRPETEELVRWIISEYSDLSPSILDIGTGSGCIAVALASHLREARVVAADISPKALETAKRNALRNKVSIQPIEMDILTNTTPINELFDLIVSNPPYVRELEKPKMHPRVLNYEPHNALFVPNNDPLQFYRAILTKAPEMLKPNGRIFFEINEALAKETSLLLEQAGYILIEIRTDIHGRNRMISGILPK